MIVVHCNLNSCANIIRNLVCVHVAYTEVGVGTTKSDLCHSDLAVVNAR
jgi:hypothetical protein